MNALLPTNLKIDTKNRIVRSVYKNCQGKPLSVINSKLYPQSNYLYNCITTFIFKNICAELSCFTEGFYGILKLQ